MTQSVLTITGKVAPHSTTPRMSDAEFNSDTEKSKRKKYYDKILQIYDDPMSVPDPVSKIFGIYLPDFVDNEA